MRRRAIDSYAARERLLGVAMDTEPLVREEEAERLLERWLGDTEAIAALVDPGSIASRWTPQQWEAALAARARAEAPVRKAG